MKSMIKLCFIVMFGALISLFIPNLNPSAQMDVDKQTEEWVVPVFGVITDEFGTRNGKHKGIDIGAPEGTEVMAVDNGIVKKSYYSKSYGNVIFIEHSNGLETVYAHLKERFVKEGKNVKKGEVIGTVGNTGISTGPHLHFEVHRGEWTFDKNNAFDPFLVFSLGDFMHDKNVQVSNHAEVIIVKKGDTLWSYAQQYDVSVEQIKRWNNLESDVIYPKQEIMIYTYNMASNVLVSDPKQKLGLRSDTRIIRYNRIVRIDTISSNFFNSSTKL